MNRHLAQLNIARFLKPEDEQANRGFTDNLDRINALAENQPGFVWRMVGDGQGVQAFDNDCIVNISVWQDLESLSAFVYRNKDHRDIMRQRGQWFTQLDVHLVLWWVEPSHTPSIEEAAAKLEYLRLNGPSEAAFTFREPYSRP